MLDFNLSWLNGTFILSCLAILGGGGAACIAFMLRSRCSRIKLCYGIVDCVREPIPMSSVDVDSLNEPARE